MKAKRVQPVPTHADASPAAEWAHVDELKPNARNPRKHGREVLRLAKTILRTTWGAPILAQRSTRRIVGGHGRLEAAREILAGIEIDGEHRGGHAHVFAQGAPGPGYVPVRWLDVSDAEADAMTLADNARGLQGEDDPLLIAEMAAQFGRESELMADVGYSAEALDRMIASAGDAVMAAAGAETGAREGDEDTSEDDANSAECFAVFALEELIDAAFRYYREKGFPYRELPLHQQMLQINKLAATNDESLIRSKYANQVADTYNAHRFAASAAGMKSPLQAFGDDTLLRKALAIDFSQGRISSSDNISSIALVSGTQACSNFRAGFAAYLYRKFGVKNGTVLDPCTGYGGRLVGWIASKLGGRYVGVDPNVPTHEANRRLADALAPRGSVSLINQPFEDVDLSALKGCVDFAFTSPPYFAKEEYSDAPTQSRIRYPWIEEWDAGFLQKLLTGCFVALRAGSHCVINIADVTIKGRTYDLEARTIRAASLVGFDHVETLRFEMTRKFGQTDEDVAFEPAFVFRKQ